MRKFNPLVKKGFDIVGLSQAELEALFLKLDQTTPQTITGGVPNLNLTEDVAPVSKGNGYLSTVGDTLYYFAGGNRYKLTATLDNPVAATDRYASLWFLFGNVHD